MPTVNADGVTIRGWCCVKCHIMAESYLLKYHISLTSDAVRPWYTTRKRPIRLIVIHTAENLPDWTGEDTGAEAVAKFGASTSRASWHATVDSDSTIQMLPDEYTAWHVRGYNSESLGVEIATQAGKWSSAPPDWKQATMERLAKLVEFWCAKHKIPAKLLTLDEVVAGESGIVGHYLLDPSRRTDPGKDFDWALLLKLIQGDDDDMPDARITDEEVQTLKEINRSLKALTPKSNGGFAGVAVQFLRNLRVNDLDESDEVEDLDARLKAIEAQSPNGASVQAVVDEVIKRLSNG